jgi:hypothetical protein
MRPATLAALLLATVAGCGSSSPRAQRDAGHDAVTDASVWFDATTLEDGPRPHPDVAPIPGLTVAVDNVPWYVLNGSTSYSPAQARSFISAMVSCDACTDVSQFLIALPADTEDSWVTNECGPSSDTINFNRSSISTHPWRSATGGNCGFNISEAGGDESVRVVGSFHGVVTNIDGQVTVTYNLDIDFDLPLGISFP